ncbi:hypothetical protein AOQ84DRAFT_442453 [Glonium stellatum]|uniref:Zn(2)-C6 fungal-type domain-containing protein n=1 Tax=Glonium stellatum TaxID=574774 RepID=A0A8E2JNN6_9PEZI|nr:hypothetical protein AOQ84DRAFT_442453 [Glonium stellatum]
MNERRSNGDPGHSVASCTECQRRKQKCSREWPCNHCSARKVPHLCQFASKSVANSDSPNDNIQDPRRYKRRNSEIERNLPVYHEPLETCSEAELQAWGYMSGYRQFNFECVVPNVESVLHNIPPRSLTGKGITLCLSPMVQRKLEFELAESSQSLTERYHRAAQKLSGSFAPASWLKSEILFVESWHALGMAIREAQELANLYPLQVHRQMSVLLSRPLIIDHSSCSFQLPNLRLDDSNLHPGLPSPFTHMALQGQLARILSNEFRESDSNLPPEQVANIQKKVQDWIASLPPIYSIMKPDTSWDDEHQYVVLQRYQIHAVAYMIKLHPLKPYLTKRADLNVPGIPENFRVAGIDCCLKLLSVSRQLFDLEFPLNAKFHMAVFCIFDTAAILCSAIIHDSRGCLPQRSDVLKAIIVALDILQQLSHTTKTGEMSYSFLSKLVTALPLSQEERSLSDSKPPKRAKTNIPSLDSELISGLSSGKNVITLPTFPAVEEDEVAASTSKEEDWQLTSDPFFQKPDFDDSFGVDLGGMEQMWDWGALNLDLSSLD